MVILRLEPPIQLETPKGSGGAYFLIDRGRDNHLEWVTFINETGECWTFENPDIRLQHNLTSGRPDQEHTWRSFWKKS